MLIERLGHTGVYADDLAAMTDFYERVMGLEVTDRDDRLGLVFLSSRPEEEHHEFVLQRGRVGGPDTKLLHQISWRVRGVEALREFHRRFLEEGVRIQQAVTHGNALAIYFFDVEGNRNEVYWPTGVDVPQPFRKSIDLTLPAERILAEAERLLEDDSPAYQPVE